MQPTNGLNNPVYMSMDADGPMILELCSLTLLMAERGEYRHSFEDCEEVTACAEECPSGYDMTTSHIPVDQMWSDTAMYTESPIDGTHRMGTIIVKPVEKVLSNEYEICSHMLH